MERTIWIRVGFTNGWFVLGNSANNVGGGRVERKITLQRTNHTVMLGGDGECKVTGGIGKLWIGIRI